MADERRYTSVMATIAEDVLKEALQLSEGERARVAAELLASLEPDVETRDAEAWIAEASERWTSGNRCGSRVRECNASPFTSSGGRS